MAKNNKSVKLEPKSPKRKKSSLNESPVSVEDIVETKAKKKKVKAEANMQALFKKYSISYYTVYLLRIQQFYFDFFLFGCFLRIVK